VISSWDDLRRGRPYAFTEQGVVMLSNVLRRKRAIQVNIEIMGAFVRLRRMPASHADLARKPEALEKKYDAQFRIVFDAIRRSSRLHQSRRSHQSDSLLGKIRFIYEKEKEILRQIKRGGSVECCGLTPLLCFLSIQKDFIGPPACRKDADGLCPSRQIPSG